MIQIIPCTKHVELSNNITQRVPCKLINICTSTFSLQEQHVEFLDPIDIGHPIYIIQSVFDCANSALLKLMMVANELKSRGVKHVHSILPYMPYSRQNKPLYNSDASVLQLILYLLDKCNIDSIITVDLHDANSTSLSSKKLINIDTTPLFAQFISTNNNLNSKDIVIVAPDYGSQIRAAKLARLLQCPHVVMQKQRQRQHITISCSVDMSNKTCIIIDDIVDGGRTLEIATAKLLDLNALEVFACCTHIIPQSPFLHELDNLHIQSIAVTNSIAIDVIHPKLTLLDISSLIANNILSNQH